MALLHLEEEKLEDVVKSGVVIVDFFATWCGPCKMLSPVLDSLADSLDIVKVDVDKHDDLARKYGVMSVPTLILFKDGVEVSKHIGFIPEEKIREIVAKM